MMLLQTEKRFQLTKDVTLSIVRDGVALLEYETGKIVTLNPKRSRFLACLAETPGRVVSYSRLHEACTGELLSDHALKKPMQDLKWALVNAHPEFGGEVVIDGKPQKILEGVGGGYRFNCTQLPSPDELEDPLLRDLRLKDDRMAFAQSGNVLLASRGEIEQRFTLEHSFGCEIIRWIRGQKSGTIDYAAYKGPQPVKEIFFFGGAGTTLFEPAYSAEVQYRDRLAVQFPELLKVLLVDPVFFLDVILTEPGSPGAADGIRFNKLGNEKFADSPNTTFTASVTELVDLLRDSQSPYHKAHADHRLSIHLTEMAIPYAVLGVRYKPEYKEAWGFEDYVKVDLYSENITHPKTRPSMVIFESRNKAMFDFFSEKFMQSKRDQFSRDLGSYSEDLKAEWRRDWEEFKRKMPRK